MTASPRIVIALLATAGLLAACSSDSSSTSQEQAEGAGVTVVATTTILGDIAGQVATCGGATITTLMPIGADPHDFSASSEQVAAMVTADLVVANGLGLESGLTDALEAAATDGATVLSIGELVEPLPAGADDGHADENADEHVDEHADEHDHGEFDPHIWFDMQRMATAAQLIGDELTKITGEDAFTTCGAQVASDITEAEVEVAALMTSVPESQRVIVTDHRAYGYLADRYGYEIAGAVIPSITTDAEPSSADLAELVDVMNRENVNAIFADVAAPTTLADAVAAETGRDVQVVQLYEGSLGAPDSSANTYIGFMKTNAELIAQSLTN